MPPKTRRKAAAEDALRLDLPPVTKQAEPAVEVEVPAEPAAPEDPAPEVCPADEHADIGNWEAIRWRGRKMWRHRRTGATHYDRKEVWRQRNLK